MQEYQFIYKRSISEEFKDIFVKAQINDEAQIQEKISEMKNKLNKKASVHFGQPYFNSATIAGLYRILLKEIAKSYNLEI